MLLLKKLIRLHGTFSESLLTETLPSSHEFEAGSVWKMHTEVPFQQSSGKFSSIPSLNLPTALPLLSPVKYSLTLYRSKSQQGSDMRLPGALISSALFSLATTHCKSRDSRGMTVCKVRLNCCQKGICWILQGGQQVCDYTMTACGAEGLLHNSQCNLIA